MKLNLEILEKIKDLDLQSIKMSEEADGGISVVFTDAEEKNKLSEIAKEVYGIENSEEALKNLFDELIERFYTGSEDEVPEHAKTEKMKNGESVE